MLKPTSARAYALLFAMIGGAILTAQAQETPAPDNKWPVRQPHLVFYDDPPTPLLSPAAESRIESRIGSDTIN